MRKSTNQRFIEYEEKMGDNYVQIVMKTKDKGDLKKLDAFIESVKFKR